ncbi:MAG: hypothetical protein ACK4E0_06835 [Chitinophagaceae bacterium]
MAIYIYLGKVDGIKISNLPWLVNEEHSEVKKKKAGAVVANS